MENEINKPYIYTKKSEMYIQTKKRCIKLDDLIDMIEEILDRKIDGKSDQEQALVELTKQAQDLKMGY